MGAGRPPTKPRQTRVINRSARARTWLQTSTGPWGWRSPHKTLHLVGLRAWTREPGGLGWTPAVGPVQVA